jgi:hypothetical protein
MSEHIITGANDVDIVLEQDGTRRGTEPALGRIIVDEFSLTREEDDSLGSGVGSSTPDGIISGNVTHSWSFTMMGQDVDTFAMIAGSEGTSNIFSFTARKTDDDGNIEWEHSLGVAKATSEEKSASSGDAHEYAVEGIGFQYDANSETNNVWG